MPIPEFVVALREKVGPDHLLWLVGATAVVLDGSSVLLVRRSDNGRWAPVTGVVDPGEHPARTAVRETLEETRVVCEVEGLARVTVTPEGRHPNGDRAQYLDHTFRCRYVGGKAGVGDEESSEVGWFDLDALPEMGPLLRARIDAAVSFDGTTRLT